MEWCTLYDMNHEPKMEQIDAFVHSECWDRLREYLEDTYQVSPKIEYSRCSAAFSYPAALAARMAVSPISLRRFSSMAQEGDSSISF